MGFYIKDKYKARLVALGTINVKGWTAMKLIVQLVNFYMIRLFIVLFICILGWKHTLLDIKSAYLYGNIDILIYLRPPPELILLNKSNYVLKLNKAIYGLHRARCC